MKKTILIVDDNELNITILLNILGSTYDVSVSLGAEDAMESIEDELPDLIVSDIYLGGISGIDICRSIKEDENRKHIPIILVSAAHDSLKSVALSIGADDFLGSPIEGAILRSKIKKLLNPIS